MNVSFKEAVITPRQFCWAGFVSAGSGVAMTKKKKIGVPDKTMADAAHAVAKVGLSAIPILGGPAAELFQHVYNRRLRNAGMTRWRLSERSSKS